MVMGSVVSATGCMSHLTGCSIQAFRTAPTRVSAGSRLGVTPEPGGQPLRVVRRVHLDVVVEVDDHVPALVAPLPHPGGPACPAPGRSSRWCRARRRRAAARRRGRGGRLEEHRPPAGGVRGHHGDVVLAQQVEERRRSRTSGGAPRGRAAAAGPRRSSARPGPPSARRDRRRARPPRPSCAAAARRSRPAAPRRTRGSAAAATAAGPSFGPRASTPEAKKLASGVSTLAQLLHVGDEPAALDGEQEVLGGVRARQSWKLSGRCSA